MTGPHDDPCPLGYRNAETEPDPTYRRLEHDRSPGLTFSRRGFFATSGLALAGATLFACTGGGRKAAVVTPSATASVVATPTRWPIKRVIYLMLENRSFDNLYGRFPGANGTTVVREEGVRRRRRGRVLLTAQAHRGQLVPAVPHPSDRAHPQLRARLRLRAHPRADARPLDTYRACYGTPWEFPGEDYPGWPASTEPDSTRSV